VELGGDCGVFARYGESPPAFFVGFGSPIFQEKKKKVEAEGKGE